MDKTLLHTTMLSAVNAYEPSELISRIVGTVLLTLVAYFCSPRGLQGAALRLLGKKINKEIRDRASPRRSAARGRPVPCRFH